MLCSYCTGDKTRRKMMEKIDAWMASFIDLVTSECDLVEFDVEDDATTSEYSSAFSESA